MTNIKDCTMTMTEKKVSLPEVENQKVLDLKKTKKYLESIGLRDRFYIVHMLFFLLGLMHFLPYSFFVTANAYWMEKFRNVSAEATDATARTSLQSYFASATSVSNSVPFTIFMVLSTIYGHKIKARSRVLPALMIMTTCFVIATGFIMIDTDSWQTLFFIITMVTLGIINAANAVLEIGTLVILSKFPPYYMKVYLLGEGFAGLFNATLQILSLAIGTSTTASALLYFTTGSSCLLFSFILYYFIKYNRFYMHFIEHSPEDTARKLLPYSEMKNMFKLIWPSILTFTLLSLGNRPTHSAVTSLVVSENYGKGDTWSDVYFVPVVTFLFADIAAVLGRIVASKINRVFKPHYITVLMLVRTVVFVPLIFLCNAQPRNHLPVLIPHDWQYIIILGTFSLTNGYLCNMIFLDITKVVEPDKVEDAYMVFMTFLSIIGAVISPISLVAVDIL